MLGELWWVPSLVVLAVATAAVVALVLGLRRRGRTLAAGEQDAVAEIVKKAAISLVRADDAVQETADEVGFAVAQFGESAAREFAEALETSRRQLRDAFALQQKLDDAFVDTPAERKRWSTQIIALADEATNRLALKGREFDTLRGVERDALHQLDRVQHVLTQATERIAAAEDSIRALGAEYATSALAPMAADLARAQTSIEQAHRAATDVQARLDAGTPGPVGDLLNTADQESFRATQLLDTIEAAQSGLLTGATTLQTAVTAAERSLAESRELRDRHEESDARDLVNQGISEADAVLAELRQPNRLIDPVADLTRLQRVMDRVDVTTSDARNRQLRLENARDALGGALLTARSQITVTRDYITANRSRVGASARTRLAEAQRQLSLAEAEADPVTALDTARQAMTHATDADALARYDLL
ncbi:hypothetical protein [Homoserinimonas sp. OAct 916]|uniref:hypothetical protein n=1 Tax=Homoserinimonas sp. OAct 916 TaxID=2211450 RepID=UPI0013004742|nr:hypothetical protein [Homoserinimonas sp. OAct 916]